MSTSKSHSPEHLAYMRSLNTPEKRAGAASITRQREAVAKIQSRLDAAKDKLMRLEVRYQAHLERKNKKQASSLAAADQQPTKSWTDKQVADFLSTIIAACNLGDGAARQAIQKLTGGKDGGA